MKKRYKLLFSLAFAMFSMSCSSSNSSEEPQKKPEIPKEPEVTAVRAQQPVNIVCIGNSITAGYGSSTFSKAWPGQLGKLLGSGYSVLNCGVSGTTMFKDYDESFWNTSSFAEAKNANPQILFIALGTNDADPWRWNRSNAHFKSDYLDMVAQFRQNGRDPIIYVCLAPPLFGKDEQNNCVEQSLIPAQKEIAEQIGAYIIDYHTPLLNNSKEFPDGVHPDDKGAALLANIAYQRIKETQIIKPEVSVSDGKLVNETVIIVKKGGTVTLKPTPESGNWKWTGPDSFTATNRVLKLENVQRGGTYTAIRTDEANQRSLVNFLVSIDGEEGNALTPRIQNMAGTWTNSKYITVQPGGNIKLGPEVANNPTGFWSWTGPDNFFANTREISLNAISHAQAGKYTAYFTDDHGRQSSVEFTVKVEGQLICPDLVPYISYGGWKQTSEMEVSIGDGVTLGPQPTNGDWHWEGPNGYTSDNREARITNFDSSKAGEYTGTFTNAAGCRDELTITLKVKK